MYSINYHATGLSQAPASSSDAGQMRTLPEHISRLGTPLKFSFGAWEFLEPERLAHPRLGLWLAGQERGCGGSRPPPGALSTCYLATQKATGRIPFGTPGKAFNFISSHVNIPECSNEGLCFAQNNINILFAATQVCSSYPNSFFPLLCSNSLYPFPLVKKKITDVYFIDIT